MSRSGMRSFLVALSLVAAAAPAHAKCMLPTRSPTVLTSAEVPAGTGVLVSTSQDQSKEDEGEAFQPTWEWKDATGTTKPTVKTLAPGLVIYEVPANVTSVELFDGKRARATVAVGAPTPSTLVAPNVKTIGHSITEGRRSSDEFTKVTLATPAPADAVAMVIYDAKTKHALSYGLVNAGNRSVMVYERGSCGINPDGTVTPKLKQKVVVRFVDQFGRLSRASKARTIQRGTSAR